MYLTPSQIAKRLRVRKERVLDWIRKGTLPALNLGTTRPRFKVRPADLERFEAERAVAITPRPQRSEPTPADVIEYY